MRYTIRSSLRLVMIAALLCAFLSVSLSQLLTVRAATQAGDRLVTIHDRGENRSVISSKTTLREVFTDAGIIMSDQDIVEPSLDEKLTGNDYHVNVYRARPITIVDGKSQIRVMTAYQTPKQIAEHAGIVLHDEDKTVMTLPEDMVHDGASFRLVIDRALPVDLTLYGKRGTVFTRATTVAEFLKEKKITLGPDDTVSADRKTAITANMVLQIWRNGKQTVTVDEEVDFPTRQIQDANQKVGYREVKTPGVKGKASVTYEIVMKDGQEVSRTKIQSVVVAAPSEQVEVVGSKPTFDGDFAAALAKLRACEGGYNSWNPAGPYYGAYQFNQGTWSSVTDAPYGSATPAQQDEAARKLYERRGWQPWPSCGKGLPDIYR